MAGTPGKLVLALLDEFAKDVREAYTINQLALSTKKAYANTHATVQQLLKEDILRKETVGHSHLCKLNLENDTTLLYLCLLQSRKKARLLRNTPEILPLLKRIDQLCAEHHILLVWKRAEDLLFITTKECTELKKEFSQSVTLRTLPEFLNDVDLQATVGKHTLLFGHALYASLLREPRLLEVLR